MVSCLLFVVCCLLFVVCGLLFAVCCLLFVQLLYIDFAKLFMMILRMMMMIMMMRTNNVGLAEGYQPKGTNLRKFGRACNTHTYREKVSMLTVTRHDFEELRVEPLHKC